jgi:tetratricopeptide (TPR) repeat protein
MWIALSLAAALVLPPPGEVRAEETAAPVEPGQQGGEAAVEKKPKKKTPQRKSRKQARREEKERQKYAMGQETAEALEQARGHFEAQRYAEAMAALDELRLDRLTPHELAQTKRFYGYVAYGKEEHDAAIAYLREALADPEALQPRDRADVLFQISQIQAGKERWRDVIATLETWLETVEKPNSVGFFLLALSHFQLEEFEAALAPAQEAVEIAKVPQQSWLQLLLAIHLTRQDYAAAKPVLDRMIALYPNSGKDYWLQLSALHGVTGDDARALGVLELAYRKGLLSDDRDLLRLLQYMMARGIPYRAAKLFEKEMSAERFQANREALEMLGISWILAREPARAEAPLARAAELSPNGELYVHLAQIHLLDEDWQKAAAVLRKALAKGGLSNPGTAQLMLGIAYYNEHQLQEARSWFAQAQRSGATREQAENWIEHVDREIAASRSSLDTGG